MAEHSEQRDLPDATDIESVAIVGAGAVGFSLGRALVAGGVRIVWVASRSAASAEELADALGTSAVATDSVEQPDADAVLLCVPDDAIESVSAHLAVTGGWAGRIAGHVSGSLSSSVLDKLTARGADVVSFHPMMTLHRDTLPASFRGVRVNLEGSARGVAAGVRWARSIGAVPHVIDAKTKTAIHVAATVASNYLVTLMTIASEILSGAGVDREEYESLLRPLAEATLSNLGFERPGQALTGPISRGDVLTLERHMQLIEAEHRGLLPAIVALASETVRVAVEAGHISAEKAESQLSVLRAFVQDSLEDRASRK